ANPASAFDSIREAYQLWHLHKSPLVYARLAATEARLWLAQGKLAAAARWAEERKLGMNDEPTYLREFEHLTLARLLTAQGRHTEAVRLAGRLLAEAERTGRTGSVIEILIVQAAAFRAQGDTAQALTSLKLALSLAEAEGYIRTFVDEGT